MTTRKNKYLRMTIKREKNPTVIAFFENENQLKIFKSFLEELIENVKKRTLAEQEKKDIVVQIAEFVKSLEGKKIPYNIIRRGLIPLRKELEGFIKTKEIFEK